MLGSRKITAMLAAETLGVSVARGCLQGRVLSPLLWRVVVDKLIKGLNVYGCFALGFTNDIATLITGNFLDMISESLQEGLNMVIIPFTRKRDLRGRKEPSLNGHTLQQTTGVRYLGHSLDKGFTWKAQLKM
jgi:hypothetical protein